MGQKLGADDRTNRVAAEIFGSGATTAVSKKPGKGIGAARFKRPTENVAFFHPPSMADLRHYGLRRDVVGRAVTRELGALDDFGFASSGLAFASASGFAFDVVDVFAAFEVFDVMADFGVAGFGFAFFAAAIPAIDP